MSTWSTPSTSSTPPPGDDSLALREALDAGAPAPSAAMRAALSSFRARLPRHPAVRRLERGSLWYWLFAARLTLRWTALGLALLILAASLTATGRTAIARAAGLTFETIDGFVKRRVDAGYDTYQVYQKRKKWTAPTPRNASVGSYVGLTPDGRLVLTVYQNQENEALWAVDPGDGHYEVLRDRNLLYNGCPIPSGKNDGKIEALLYITTNRGLSDVIRAAVTGQYRTQSLWLHDLKTGPVLIDEGMNIREITIAPDRKKFCYTRTDPQSGPPPIRLYNLETQKLRRLHPSAFETVLAFAPRGDSLILLDQRFIPGGRTEIAGIRQVSLDQEKIIARLDFPPGRSLQDFCKLKDCLLVVHNDVNAGALHGDNQPAFDQQIERIVWDPMLGFTKPSIKLAKDETFLQSWQRDLPKGNEFFTFNKSSLKRWICDAMTGKPLADLTGWPLYDFPWSPDGRRVAVNSGEIGRQLMVFEPSTGKQEKFTGTGKLLGWIDNERLLFLENTPIKLTYPPSSQIRLKIYNLKTQESKIVEVSGEARPAGGGAPHQNQKSNHEKHE